jgi:hypothetical protein
VASFVVGQVPTGILVVGVVTLSVAMGSAQELKARASVDALGQFLLVGLAGWRRRTAHPPEGVPSPSPTPSG